MKTTLLLTALLLSLACFAQEKSWTFAVSGDSRNCGDVVMPAIAAGAKQDGASFYWHLGDFRAIYKVDEDFLASPDPNFARHDRDTGDPLVVNYLQGAWDDFFKYQIKPFDDLNLPVFLAMGNHETYMPKAMDDLMTRYKERFDTLPIREQRFKDLRFAPPATHYHWVNQGVDFITLDNSVNYMFDTDQLNWLYSVLKQDESDPNIKAIVVGMHAALPDSVAADHSMCSTDAGIASGRAAYRALAAASATRHVYVLASHSHYFLDNLYDTQYWRDARNGGAVLSGWIVGTAGAVRYALPAGATGRAHEYGYLKGTVTADGKITFQFQPLTSDDLKRSASPDFKPDFVQWCVDNNPPREKMHIPEPRDYCKEKQ